ncbi:hypothetical protein OEZ86_000097 [Tetradesmus obliquus]|nr:hypothetical protein OEZ86_000097 [Tetradesmus obliquus]
MAAAAALLASYDVRYDVARPARLSSSRGRPRGAAGGGVGPAGLGPSEVCLTAAAAAAAAAKARRVRKRQAPAEPPVPADVLEQQPHPALAAAPQQAPQQQPGQQRQQQQQQQQAALLPDDDPRWQAVLRAHAAHLSYMQQLASMVVSKHQQGHQLVHQVGICEHWLQLSHMLSVMGGPELLPAVPAAMWKRLPDIVSRKVFVRMSPAERVHYDLFLEQLQWLADMTSLSQHMLASLQPTQLWGVLWGLSQVAHLPPPAWLDSWLAAAREQLPKFDAEGLAHAAWALAALGHVPDKLWLRTFAGMVAHRVRSFMAPQLAMLLPALSSLGYKPRSEVCRTLVAQARRQLHTFKPSQLAALLAALAAYPPPEGAPASTSGWHPGRLFLFDFISASSPPGLMQAWSGGQAAQVLWAFARFRYVPDKAYLQSLLAHLATQLPATGPDGLALAAAGLAGLRQPLPSQQWGDAWCAAALAGADGFGPEALAQALPSMAALHMQPPAALMQALTRTASSCLCSCSCGQLALIIAALADLQWRPSDAWMAAFVSHASQQLPACEGENYGLLLHGLAALGQPLSADLLGLFAAEAGRKLAGASGEGLALLLWGLAQYGYGLQQSRDAAEWWAALFAESSTKWDSCSQRGCALMLTGLAQLGPRHLPPGECLANQLNVTLEESHDDTLINARGQWTRGGAEGLLTTQNGSYTAPAFNLTDMDGDTDDLQDRMWELLLGMKATNPLTGATPSPHPAKSCASYRSMGHYINTTLGLEAYAFLIADMPEPGNMQFPVDVCAWIQSEINERTIRSKITTQFIAHGGWHGIIERARAVAAAASVRFFLDSPIAGISSIAGNATAASALHVTAADGTTSNRNSSYQFVTTGPGGVSGRVFIAEHLIFASGPLDVRKLGGNVGRRLAAAPEAASIRPVEVAVYDALYPQRFWEDYMVHRYGNMPVRTDANCLVFSEFPGHTYFRVKNATRPVYATGLRCIAFWRQLHAASGMPGIRNYVQSSLQGLFPVQEVPAPYLDTLVVHADGWHLMDYGASQRNVSIASIYSWAASPLGDHANLCLAGEAYYGISYGWTAGAWRTAAHCIKQRFAGVLSGAALAAVEYVSSGCNGRARFPNDIVLPRNASMPGLNPARGKVLPTVE